MSHALPLAPPPQADADPFPFTPHVPERLTRNGWTPEVQRGFIRHLSATGIVSRAARAVGKSPRSAWQLRRRPGAESFAAAWDCAIDHVECLAFDAVMERLHADPGAAFRSNNRLLMKALDVLDRRHAGRDPHAAFEATLAALTDEHPAEATPIVANPAKPSENATAFDANPAKPSPRSPPPPRSS